MNTNHIVTRDQYFSDEELVKLFKWMRWVNGHPDWKEAVFLVRAILGLGVRIGELPQIYIPTDCSDDGVIIIRKTKTSRPRSVKCSPEFMPYYEAKLRERRGQGYLFQRLRNGDGYGYDAQIAVRTLRRWWTDVINASGVRYLHPHAGRHTWATWELATKRLDIKEVQAQLGHSKIEMTLQIYTHASVETRYEEDKTPEWWGEALKGIGGRKMMGPLSIVA